MISDSINYIFIFLVFWFLFVFLFYMFLSCIFFRLGIHLIVLCDSASENTNRLYNIHRLFWSSFMNIYLHFSLSQYSTIMLSFLRTWILSLGTFYGLCELKQAIVLVFFLVFFTSSLWLVSKEKFCTLTSVTNCRVSTNTSYQHNGIAH